MSYYALSIGMTQKFVVFLSLVILTFDLDRQTLARLLYNLPSRQVWSSYI